MGSAPPRQTANIGWAHGRGSACVVVCECGLCACMGVVWLAEANCFRRVGTPPPLPSWLFASDPFFINRHLVPTLCRNTPCTQIRTMTVGQKFTSFTPLQQLGATPQLPWSVAANTSIGQVTQPLVARCAQLLQRRERRELLADGHGADLSARCVAAKGGHKVAVNKKWVGSKQPAG